jgi:hypothetical protein
VEEEEDNSDKNFYEEWHPLRRLLNRIISTTSINKFNNIIIDTSNYSLLEEAFLSYDYNNKALLLEGNKINYNKSKYSTIIKTY